MIQLFRCVSDVMNFCDAMWMTKDMMGFNYPYNVFDRDRLGGTYDRVIVCHAILYQIMSCNLRYNHARQCNIIR